ncbi:MAG: hypothetical protein DRP65_11460 [Planctomycetota bacterium]|nr:MAG: hypothetical protein DRP65_11460 [Planctomycetota bacterium]
MTIPVLVIVALLGLVCGCDNGGRSSLRDEFETLSRERGELKRQVEELQSENKELTGRIGQLAALTDETKLEALPELERIELGRRTGLYDKDGDGRKDKLVVYISPYDTTADTIKAPGSVKISLWDLNAGSEGAQLGEWQIAGTELKGAWAGTFLTNYYRLTLDAGQYLTGDEGELTLNVTFTDYIGGKVLTAQKVIKP